MSTENVPSMRRVTSVGDAGHASFSELDNASDEETTVDSKKAAVNYKQNGNRRRFEENNPPTDEKYAIGNPDMIKRGFLLEFCDFTRKKRAVDAARLITLQSISSS